MPARVLVGVVASDKSPKTRRVEINRTVKHPQYGKYVKRRTVCHVHDENNESSHGDTVKIVESAPSPGASCQAVIIGTSTGGPRALKAVLPKLPADLSVPVLVVQHMPAQYTTSLAKRLDEACCLKVMEAVDRSPANPGEEPIP